MAALGFEARSIAIYKPEDKIKLFDLVCAGASPRQWSDWLRPPLEHAAAAGEVDLLKMLIRAGARVEANWKGCRGRTLLHAAAQGGKHEIISSLLKAGAKSAVNAQHHKKRWTALHYAASGGHETMVRVLMFAGANVSCTDMHENTPLLLAAQRGHGKIASDLALGGADVNKLNQQRLSPLSLAAVNGNVPTTEALLTAGADVDLRCGTYSRTALEEAACKGHVGVMRALIQHGVDVSAGNPNEHGVTSLHYAAYFDQPAAVDMLVIEGGADIEATTSDRNAPIFIAAQENNCNALRVILQHKANVEVQNEYGVRPLATASRYLAEGTVELLLRSGADETHVDNEGRSARDIVGKGVSSAERPDREDGMNRVQRLLAHAPMDRAWRRRGMLVLCRAFPDKVNLRVDGNQGVGDAESQSAFGRHVAKFARTVKIEVQRAPADSGGEKCMMRGDIADEGSRDISSSVEARVIKLEQEGVFRRILGFL